MSLWFGRRQPAERARAAGAQVRSRARRLGVVGRRPARRPPGGLAGRRPAGVSATPRLRLISGSRGSRAGGRRSSGRIGFGRHPDARLDPLRVDDPAGQVAPGVRQDPADQRPAADVRQVGADPAHGRRSPGSCGTSRRSSPRKTSRPRRSALGRRLGRRPPPGLEPAPELLLRLGHDDESHERVLVARRTRRTGPRTSPAGRPGGRVRVGWPGIMSRLPWRLGTQKLWITSVDCRSNWTVRPTGMWISLAVVTIRLGSASWYWTSHHHWWPVTRIVRASGSASAWIARPVAKSPIEQDEQDRHRRRRPSPTTSRRQLPLLGLGRRQDRRASSAAGPAGRRPDDRWTPSRRRRPPTHDPEVEPQKSRPIRPAWGPAGSSADCAAGAARRSASGEQPGADRRPARRAVGRLIAASPPTWGARSSSASSGGCEFSAAGRPSCGRPGPGAAFGSASPLRLRT